MGEQRPVLEHHAHTPTLWALVIVGGRHHPIIERDLTTGDALQAGDRAQQGCFPTATRAKQSHHLARRHIEINAVQDLHTIEGRARTADQHTATRRPTGRHG